MRAIAIDVDGWPREVELPDDTNGRLEAMQGLVGGPVELLHGVLGDDVDVWVDEEGLLDGAGPNRAIYATKAMEEAGFVSQLDGRTPVREGDLCATINGGVVVTGIDPETGEAADLVIDPRDGKRDQYGRVMGYFTQVSAPGSALMERHAARGLRRRPSREDVACGLAAMQATAYRVPTASTPGEGSQAASDMGHLFGTGFAYDFARWVGERARAYEKGQLRVIPGLHSDDGKCFHDVYEGHLGEQPGLMGVFARFSTDYAHFVVAVSEEMGHYPESVPERVAFLDVLSSRFPESSFAREASAAWVVSQMRRVTPPAQDVIKSADEAFMRGHASPKGIGDDLPTKGQDRKR